MKTIESNYKCVHISNLPEGLKSNRWWNVLLPCDKFNLKSSLQIIITF